MNPLSLFRTFLKLDKKKISVEAQLNKTLFEWLHHQNFKLSTAKLLTKSSTFLANKIILQCKNKNLNILGVSDKSAENPILKRLFYAFIRYNVRTDTIESLVSLFFLMFMVHVFRRPMTAGARRSSPGSSVGETSPRGCATCTWPWSCRTMLTGPPDPPASPTLNPTAPWPPLTPAWPAGTRMHRPSNKL